MDEMPVQWAGLNHLALITNDLDRTTRFWHGVLGAPLVASWHCALIAAPVLA
jgi:catechol 2,3-dioxygenase-like lactoylglutathione lyase family enzyme